MTDATTIAPGWMTAAAALALPHGTAVIMLVETAGTDHRGEERTYPAGAIATVSRHPHHDGDAVTVTIGHPDKAIVNVFDRTDYAGEAFPFGRHPIATLVAAARRIDDDMCDPKGDGTGEGARAPTGDDYNQLLVIIELAAAAMLKPVEG